MLRYSGRSRAVLLIIAVFVIFFSVGTGGSEVGVIIAASKKSDERFAKGVVESSD